MITHRVHHAMYKSVVYGEPWSDESWRELVKVLDLMQARIHHMMAKMVRHDAAGQDRLDEVSHLVH